MVVQASAAGSVLARIEFRGSSYPLVPVGDGFWGVFAIPVDAEPGEESLRVTFHDANRAQISEASATYVVSEIERDVEHIMLPPDAAALLNEDDARREDELRAEQFAQSDPDPAWTDAFRIPVSGGVTARFGSARSYDGGPVTSFHSGVDYGAPAGAPVVASAPGRVSWTGAMPLRGTSVIVDHGAGVKSGYHHLSRIDVAVDDVVAAGDTIGAIGSTGVSTGPHLHWEISVHGVNVDPLPWLFNSFLASGGMAPPTQTESEQE
ncbi:MAG: M23 family metallopeptidase [Chloroflexi bacterium]|nr:M23 family metallopeptidase [Chloroflexota bacterium]